MTDAQSLRLYRLIKNNPATQDDVMSKAELGIPCPMSDPEVQRRWTGLSLFGSEEQARRVVRRLPMLGSFIAALDIPPGAGMRAEPTIGPGHNTLGADPGRGTSPAGKAASDMPDASFTYEVWELATRSLVATYPSEAEASALIRQPARPRLDRRRDRPGRRKRAFRAPGPPADPDRRRTGRASGRRWRMKPRRKCRRAPASIARRAMRRG
jgi:hypothetical protein